MLPAFGGLVFVSLVMLALAVEIASFGIVWRQTSSVADSAAEAAAAMIDVEALHMGDTILERPAAAREAFAVVDSAGDVYSATVDVKPDEVCVVVHRVYRPVALRGFSITDTAVDVVSCAQPRTG